MKIPKTIYLQWFGDGELCDDGLECDCLSQELIDSGAVTWCTDKIFDCDIEYIRADALRAALCGYADSDLLSLAESLRSFQANHSATLEEFQDRIVELEAAQRWIPVSEQLPDKRIPVLVGAAGHEAEKAYINTKQEWRIAANGFHLRWTPTHWRSLPALPQEPNS